MKFLETLKKIFTSHIPLKLLAIVLALVCVAVVSAVGALA